MDLTRTNVFVHASAVVFTSEWTIDDCLWSLILVLKTKEIVQGLEIIKFDSNEDPQHLKV